VDIQEIAGVVPDGVIQDFAKVLGIDLDEGMDIDDSSQQKAGGFEPIKKKVKFLMKEGYSASQIISQVGLPLPSYDSTQT
jgi:replication factor C subunit 2/4